MVVYDTGSDWLTVKSCITSKRCNKKIDEEATIREVNKKMKEGMKSENKIKKSK